MNKTNATDMALNGTHYAQICRAFVHFLFTDIKWKTLGVFVHILHGAFGSTHLLTFLCTL